LVDAFRLWAEHQLTRIPGKSDLAKSFCYGLSRWPSFCLFLEDGRVVIDNDAAERAMRPIRIGRKSWLFAGADTGAETLARAITIIETVKLTRQCPPGNACLSTAYTITRSTGLMHRCHGTGPIITP
jgi:hypothetical protein